jgi:hypothetical protein
MFGRAASTLIVMVRAGKLVTHRVTFEAVQMNGKPILMIAKKAVC